MDGIIIDTRPLNSIVVSDITLNFDKDSNERLNLGLLVSAELGTKALSVAVNRQENGEDIVVHTIVGLPEGMWILTDSGNKPKAVIFDENESLFINRRGFNSTAQADKMTAVITGWLKRKDTISVGNIKIWDKFEAAKDLTKQIIKRVQ